MDFRERLGSFAICHLSTHNEFETRKATAQRVRLNSKAVIARSQQEKAGRVAML
jgi:hypothetical protein